MHPLRVFDNTVLQNKMRQMFDISDYDRLVGDTSVSHRDINIYYINNGTFRKDDTGKPVAICNYDILTEKFTFLGEVAFLQMWEEFERLAKFPTDNIRLSYSKEIIQCILLSSKFKLFSVLNSAFTGFENRVVINNHQPGQNWKFIIFLKKPIQLVPYSAIIFTANRFKDLNWNDISSFNFHPDAITELLEQYGLTEYSPGCYVELPNKEEMIIQPEPPQEIENHTLTDKQSKDLEEVAEDFESEYGFKITPDQTLAYLISFWRKHK